MEKSVWQMTDGEIEMAKVDAGEMDRLLNRLERELEGKLRSKFWDDYMLFDVIDRILIAARKSIMSYEPQGKPFGHLLSRIVKTKCADAFRNEAEGTLSIESMTEAGFDLPDDRTPPPETTYMNKVVEEVVGEKLSRLDVIDRNIVEMGFGFGCEPMSYSEIGFELGMSKQAVSSRMAKVKSELSLDSELRDLWCAA